MSEDLWGKGLHVTKYVTHNVEDIESKGGKKKKNKQQNKTAIYFFLLLSLVLLPSYS